MKKLTLGLIVAAAFSQAAFAQEGCAVNAKKFEDAKALVLTNAKSVAEISAALAVAVEKDVTLTNDRLFEASVNNLGTMAATIETNRNQMLFARNKYKEAKCGAAAAPAAEAAPAAAPAEAAPAEAAPAP